jgi:hypothetical protein
MSIKTKHITILVTLASIGAIIYGFSIKDTDLQLANKCIGFGTVGLFLIAMPLFLIKESRGKKVKDYMLTDENIRKMQGKEEKKSENK